MLHRLARATLVHLCLLPALASAQSDPGRSGASTVVTRAIDRMGGDDVLRNLQGVRLDMMTQWLGTHLGTHPFADRPSYEHNIELRDYARHAWRNTRTFLPARAGFEIVDVVVDTVAARRIPPAPGAAPGWTPLNIAYVDERRELFAFAPERMLLHALDDPALRTMSDTTIDGIPHARVQATIDGYHATIAVRRADDLPAMVRFRADETNDFGLAPWGEMEVEFWYSQWRAMPGGVLLPMQRDVRRVGRPYKRMTVLQAEINPAIPADSFAIDDDVRAGYFASAQRPMWEVSLDSVAVVDGRFASFPPQTGMPGAILVGGTWVLIETGQAAGVPPMVEAWARRITPGTVIGAALVTMPGTGNGGVRWTVEQGLPTFVAPGALPVVTAMLEGRDGFIGINTAQWVRVGRDSLWVEPVDAPDAGGMLAVYSPTLRWLYLPLAGSPTVAAEQRALIERLTTRGLMVEYLGSRRALVAPLAPDR